METKVDSEALDEFHTDEEPESKTGQQEDMKQYLTKLNSRVENLVRSLGQTDLIAIMDNKNNKSEEIE